MDGGGTPTKCTFAYLVRSKIYCIRTQVNLLGLAYQKDIIVEC